MTGVVHNRLQASIWAEHLEEAALLYEHRWLWIEDPSLTLHDLAELEERQDAHLDGLVIGAAQTLALCERAVAEGDAAELHVGVRIACRCGWTGVLDVLSQRLRDLDEQERGEFEAAANAAAIAELPAEWAPLLGEPLEDPILGPVLADAVGLRRIPVGPTLVQLIAERGPEADPRYVRALGELRLAAALPHLRSLLGRAAIPPLWRELAVACLKLGDRDVAALVASSARISAWSPLAQVLACDVPSTWLCVGLDGRSAPECLLALGLRGDPSSLDACVERLGDDELADAAAAALVAITGAPLFDDDASEDGLFEAGPLPIHCRDPQRWSAWLDTHAREWSPGARYRLGRPCTPAVTLASLTSFSLSLELRQAVRDELAIRHGVLPPAVTAAAREQLSWFAAHSTPTLEELAR